ncbi:MAG: ABC transporter permease [Gammaproteobacteria bacterium]|nr:ABC transporter permease [Gammaproteobacteria bacterium]MBU1558787.1 ABC transporter permease [Gammaproteobacteria bacterium]MBU1628780.1 ABC transporter permease [Gammaproteobacteria bacterium]MBU1927097.1 ABC transporter permease [Gammaproteobacteria bacterium]MBU2545772.1 ABC transporter permease [Gammaproteobacteria bacterium]
MTLNFSFQRLWAVIIKEFIQMKRDHITLAMIIIIPLMQLLLFGYAINSNPKNLPTALIKGDQSSFTRTLIQSMKNTEYFKFLDQPVTEKEANYLMSIGKIQFAVNIPPGFSRKLIRHEIPDILITTDATDPVAASNAITAVNALSSRLFNRDFQGSLSYLVPDPQAFNLRLHIKYNPELITQYNIVPGLMGVILTMTMIIITALAITREYERGTMESLLATPVRPLEVMLGKVIPYIIVGYIQATLIIAAAYFLFHIPIEGSLMLLFFLALPFIAANLSIGVTFSTIAKNQLQATQMSFFFFLPSILLSGFMFPFYGMPKWAQDIGNILPLTYFLRITRGIILKGTDFIHTWPNVWPIIIFMVFALMLGLKRYRQTLD